MANGTVTRRLLLSAYELGYAQNGEFVLMDVELFKDKFWGQYHWKMNLKDDEKIRKASEAVIRIGLKLEKSDKFDEFSKRVKDRALQEFGYNFTDGDVNIIPSTHLLIILLCLQKICLLFIKVNFFIGTFYESIILYGTALKDSLSKNVNPRDARKFIELFKQQFQGITGPVHMNAKADREATYEILDMNPKTGKFEVVLILFYLEKKRQKEKGSFKF